MKKYVFNITALLALGTLGAQVRTVNSATNVSVSNSPAFIDASSNTTVNNSSNVGKGLIFPRVDLSAMTAFPSVTAGIPNSFPTRFDGMIVYNTASSGTAGVGSTSGTLTPGFWYYENKSATNTGGTWKPLLGVVGSNMNTATNGLTLSSNNIKMGGTLIEPTTINSSSINPLNIAGTGSGPAINVTASDYWISSTFSSPASGYGNSANPNKVVAGTQSGTATIGGHNNALSAWADLAINPGGGNVGIGTSSPTKKLYVNGNSQIVPADVTSIAADGLLRLGNTDYSGQTNQTLLALSPGVFSIDAPNVPAGRFIVNNVGNVGIGTANPATTLDVAGTLNVTGVSSLNSLASNTIILNGATGSLRQAYFDGLGRLTPGAAYSGTSLSTASNGLTATSGDVALGGVLTQTTTVYNNGNPFTFAGLNTGTTFTASGLVGVGTQTPASALDVIGDLHITPTAPSAIPSAGLVRIGKEDYSSQSNKTLLSLSPGIFSIDEPGVYGGRFIVSSNGYVGIGTNAPSSKLTVMGDAYISSLLYTPRVQGPSDRRFKKDITPIYNATEKLNRLNGYTYTWRDKKEFPGQAVGEGKDMGVIAQEVEQVFPDAVMTNKDGYKSVNYNALIPVLIESLKEAHREIRELKEELKKK